MGPSPTPIPKQISDPEPPKPNPKQISDPEPPKPNPKQISDPEPPKPNPDPTPDPPPDRPPKRIKVLHPQPAPVVPARTVISAVRPELYSLPLPAADSGDGLLAIDASPWALVSVDGQELGETPRELQINAGRHRIRAVHPDLGAKEGTAVVEAGKRVVWVAPLAR